MTRLIRPPAEPRPYSTAAGPLTTSTRSTLDRSRKYSASSRMPSTNWSAIAVKPRIETWSRWPSPCENDTPGTFFSASCIDVACWSRITSAVTTLTVCGTSRSGASVLVALTALGGL
ncbi:hypothetical protein D9M72_486080 [compost metagenome]